MNKDMEINQALRIKPRKRVLIIDDDIEFSSLLKQHLQRALDVQVVLVSSAYEAMDELLESVYDLVVLDWNLGGFSGLTALHKVDKAINLDDRLPLKEVEAKIPVAVLSAHHPEALDISNREKKHFRVRRVLSKRIGMKSIVAALSESLGIQTQIAV